MTIKRTKGSLCCIVGILMNFPSFNYYRKPYNQQALSTESRIAVKNIYTLYHERHGYSLHQILVFKWLLIKKRVKIVMFNNSTNINKNEQPSLTPKQLCTKKTTTYDLGYSGPRWNNHKYVAGINRFMESLPSSLHTQMSTDINER